MAPPRRTSVAVLAVPALVALGALTGCTASTTTNSSGPTSGSTSGPASPSPSSVASSPTTAASSGPSSASATPSATTSKPASSASTTPSPDAPPLPPACTTDLLKLTQGGVEGAAGSTYVTYYLRNVGPGPCTLDGHPGFALLRADGSVIQHPADRTGAVRPVQVAPGARAHFVVRTSDPGTVGDGECSYAWKTAQVQVYPPDQTKAIRQPSDVQACDLVVSAVS